MKKIWSDIQTRNRTYDMSHLRAFNVVMPVDGQQVNIEFCFGHHVFTDEKGTERKIFNRFFCEKRYELSLTLPKIIQNNFLKSYTIPYIDKDNNELYYYLEIHDYAIFFDVRPVTDNAPALRVIIISAYEVDRWGKSGLPSGTAVKISYILSLRLQGKTYLKNKKQKRRF